MASSSTFFTKFIPVPSSHEKQNKQCCWVVAVMINVNFFEPKISFPEAAQHFKQPYPFL
jgi:hypothetical protein